MAVNGEYVRKSKQVLLNADAILAACWADFVRRACVGIVMLDDCGDVADVAESFQGSLGW